MRILVTGRGTSGSWQIRGEQLGRAIGATVRPSTSDVKGFDCAVVVKRPVADAVYALRAERIPWALDIVDGWPQPTGNEWRTTNALVWLADLLKLWRPSAIIAATQVMARDVVATGFSGPVLALPHHGKEHQYLNPIREAVARVGYYGAFQYIARWSRVISKQCRSLGIEWVPDAANLDDLDIVVALRDFAGYPARQWKSNVKLANAQITGTPIICSREAGYLETCPNGGPVWVDSEGELINALEYLAPKETRLQISNALLRDAPKLTDMAGRLSRWLAEEVSVLHA